MSFVINGTKYTYQKLISPGYTGSIHLVSDDNGQLYAAKTSKIKDEDDLLQMEYDGVQGPYTTYESIMHEIQIYERIKQHFPGDWPPTICCYFDHGVFPNNELPTNMQNSYNEDVAVIIIEYIPSPIDKKYNWVELAQDLFSAVLTLQNMGILHDDLELRNILYNPLTGRYVVIDFDQAEINHRPSWHKNFISSSVYEAYTKKHFLPANRNPNETDPVIKWINQSYDMSYNDSLMLLCKMFPEKNLNVIIGLTTHHYNGGKLEIDIPPVVYSGIKISYPEAYRITQYLVAVNPEFKQIFDTASEDGLVGAYQRWFQLSKISQDAYHFHIEVYNRLRFFLVIKDSTLLIQLNTILDLHLEYDVKFISKYTN